MASFSLSIQVKLDTYLQEKTELKTFSVLYIIVPNFCLFLLQINLFSSAPIQYSLNLVTRLPLALGHKVIDSW